VAGRPRSIWARRGATLAAAAALGLLAACNGDAIRGDPALPPGFVESGIPSVRINAYGYADAGAPVSVPVSAFGDPDGGSDGIAALRVVSLVNDPTSDYATLTEFADEVDALRAGDIAAGDIAGKPDHWVQVIGSSVALGRSAGDWGDAVIDAWTSGGGAAIEKQDPDVWEALRLFPEEPPAPPVAAGFVRNVADLMDDLLDSTGVGLPGLADGLSLVRVDSVAYVVYADGVGMLPSAPSRQALRELDAGVLAAAQSGYPGFIVDLMFSNFVERSGLAEVDVDGVLAHHRTVHDLHLMLNHYGPTIFIALSPSRGGAEELLRSVIASQAAR